MYNIKILQPVAIIVAGLLGISLDKACIELVLWILGFYDEQIEKPMLGSSNSKTNTKVLDEKTLPRLKRLCPKIHV